MANVTIATEWKTTESLLWNLWTELSNAKGFDMAISKSVELSKLHPLYASILLMLLIALICWFLSTFTGNCSQVDRLWSITPFIFTGIFAKEEFRAILHNDYGKIDWRLVAMFICSLLWGIRLTFNFYRKGGYNLKDEDYRWPTLRGILPKPLFVIFNIVFISFYQNLLLLLTVLPSHIAYLVRSKTPWNAIDTLATALFLIFLIGETVADQQQWNFYKVKYGKTPKDRLNDDHIRGFLTQGLFKYSRHPNFFFEQAIWWSFYLFAVAATQVWVQWVIVGAVLLTLLFQGSTTFTEYISAKKYPAYREYQKTTSRLIPWFPGPPLPKKTQ